MAVITFRIDDDLSDQFSKIAKQEGGKSALLRQFIQNTVASYGKGTESLDEVQEKVLVPLQTRVTRPEKSEVLIAAQKKGMSPSLWLRLLIRAQLETKAPFRGELNLEKIVAEMAENWKRY